MALSVEAEKIIKTGVKALSDKKAEDIKEVLRQQPGGSCRKSQISPLDSFSSHPFCMNEKGFPVLPNYLLGYL